MNTFNASLEFDHMANVKQLQQLEELQKKLHAVLQLPGANVRASVATTDILKLVRPSNKVVNLFVLFAFEDNLLCACTSVFGPCDWGKYCLGDLTVDGH